MRFYRVITASALLLMCVQLCAQNKNGVFSVDEAKTFFENSPDLPAQTKSFTEDAEKNYIEGAFELAANKMLAAKYFDMLANYAENTDVEFRTEILGNSKFLKEFITTISPKDNLKNVFEILSKLRKSSPEKFGKYRNLAAAIAIVFDATPPANWPHGQVSEKLLSRKLPDPLNAFEEITNSRERKKFLMPTEKLSIQELKYLVASPAIEEDRKYAQQSVAVNIPNIAKLYSSINYDTPRLKDKQFDWDGEDYRLKTIKTRGGICVDQAYYTAEVAKAKGVPAFIFSGAGSDGFHAWTAYMLKSGAWNFDVGRYANARFVTGATIDPQTWEQATDHELNAMREAFRSGAKYELSEIHSMFAEHFLKKSDFPAAITAAEKAVLADSRNANAWQIIIDASTKAEKSEQAIIKIYNDAIKAFSKYPDIDASFRRELIKLLNSQGKDELARKLTTSLIIKTKSKRPDIAMEFARIELQNDIEKGEIDRLMSSYKRLVAPFKSDPAMAIVGLTIPIINSVLKTDKRDASLDILKVSRQIFKSAKDESVKASLDNVESQLNTILSNINKKD